MPGISRQGDTVITGHLCDVTTTIDTHSSDVFVNNIGVARVTDTTQVHTIGTPPLCIPHVAQVNVGSSNVFVNNLPVARIGDSTDAGSLIQGSSDVFANS